MLKSETISRVKGSFLTKVVAYVVTKVMTFDSDGGSVKPEKYWLFSTSNVLTDLTD